MKRLDELKDTVEVDEEAKRVILHFPNVSIEYDLSMYESEYYRLLASAHRKNSGHHGYIAVTASSLQKESGLCDAHPPSVKLTEKSKENKYTTCSFHSHYYAVTELNTFCKFFIAEN